MLLSSENKHISSTKSPVLFAFPLPPPLKKWIKQMFKSPKRKSKTGGKVREGITQDCQKHGVWRKAPAVSQAMKEQKRFYREIKMQGNLL